MNIPSDFGKAIEKMMLFMDSKKSGNINGKTLFLVSNEDYETIYNLALQAMKSDEPPIGVTLISLYNYGRSLDVYLSKPFRYLEVMSYSDIDKPLNRPESSWTPEQIKKWVDGMYTTKTW